MISILANEEVDTFVIYFSRVDIEAVEGELHFDQVLGIATELWFGKGGPVVGEGHNNSEEIKWCQYSN